MATIQTALFKFTIKLRDSENGMNASRIEIAMLIRDQYFQTAP